MIESTEYHGNLIFPQLGRCNIEWGRLGALLLRWKLLALPTWAETVLLLIPLLCVVWVIRIAGYKVHSLNSLLPFSVIFHVYINFNEPKGGWRWNKTRLRQNWDLQPKKVIVKWDPLGQGSAEYSPWVKPNMQTFFWKQSLIGTVTPLTAYSSFYTTRAELTGCDRDWMAHKAHYPCFLFFF